MMTIPNMVTLSRIGLLPVFVVLFYLQPNYLEGEPLAWINNSLVAIYVLISSTDFLDGLLARKLNQISDLGTFLDPVADKLMVCTALILLTDYYQTWFITIPSIIIISREILVSALREWMSEIGKRANISVSWIGKSKTFMQMIAILFLLFHQPLFIFSYNEINMMGRVLLFSATILTLWSGIKYLIAGLKTFDS
ncbi:MAG: CDP-diacylglycerol--glycerol-3-phosphate 3-phosphatidyltransferase [Candidatus Thioglobus autotrophicus]|nr:CDP-diacylglycerol--glycerol-3-phosphate 3-phosphatidyltransferase [Candidatus Thioglobus autotrophicus]